METGAEVVKRNSSEHYTIFPVDYVPAEQNLETIGYFSAHYKRRYPRDKQSSKVVVLSGSRRIEIIPSAKYGFPNADDLDFYRAFLKICDERAIVVREEQDGQTTFHPKLPCPIGFRTREIIAKAGRKKSARETVAVREWVERLNSTVVHGELYDAKTQKYNAKIGLEPLFRKFAHVGRPMESGDTASMNYVWLSDWFIDNYFHYYVRRVDLRFHQRLSRPIAKALYPLLDNGWFAANGGAFTKRYGDLCAILDIQPYQQLSRVQQQLDPSHAELVREQFLASYEYLLDEQGKWTGTIRWCPGPKWFYDQEQKKRRKELASQSDQSFATAELLINNDPPSPPPQMALPLQPQGTFPHLTYTGRVGQFYAQLGYPRVPQQKISAGVKLLADLVEKQGYSQEDIDVALAWTVKNQDKFAGNVYSLNLLPHVIDRALEETKKARAREKKKQLRLQNQQQAALAHVRLQFLEERLASLSQVEQEQWRARAIESLVAQDIKKPFLEMESLIRSEMLHLLSQNVTLSAGSSGGVTDDNG